MLDDDGDAVSPIVKRSPERLGERTWWERFGLAGIWLAGTTATYCYYRCYGSDSSSDSSS